MLTATRWMSATHSRLASGMKSAATQASGARGRSRWRCQRLPGLPRASSGGGGGGGSMRAWRWMGGSSCFPTVGRLGTPLPGHAPCSRHGGRQLEGQALSSDWRPKHPLWQVCLRGPSGADSHSGWRGRGFWEGEALTYEQQTGEVAAATAAKEAGGGGGRGGGLRLMPATPHAAGRRLVQGRWHVHS